MRFGTQFEKPELNHYIKIHLVYNNLVAMNIIYYVHIRYNLNVHLHLFATGATTIFRE